MLNHIQILIINNKPCISYCYQRACAADYGLRLAPPRVPSSLSLRKGPWVCLLLFSPGVDLNDGLSCGQTACNCFPLHYISLSGFQLSQFVWLWLIKQMICSSSWPPSRMHVMSCIAYGNADSAVSQWQCLCRQLLSLAGLMLSCINRVIESKNGMDWRGP